MKYFIVVLSCITMTIINNPLFAQHDPFAAIPRNKDAAALSPSELPSFEQYRSAPANINVSVISPTELAYVIDDSREKIFILDARSKEEYSISHIETARRAGFVDFSVERIWMVDRQARIIIYSSDQKRSDILAQYLKLMGFTDIQILAGGLINWKNAGNDVFNKDGKTDKVHVGRKENLKLLKSGLGNY